MGVINRRRFDLLVVGCDDQRVQLVADTDLPRERAERRYHFYEPLQRHTPLRVHVAHAGIYSPGDYFQPEPEEEEE